jgi:hypothetical protein
MKLENAVLALGNLDLRTRFVEVQAASNLCG